MEEKITNNEDNPKKELVEHLFGTDTVLDEEADFKPPTVWDVLHFVKGLKEEEGE